MNDKKYFLAIDIGASSGRHIIGWNENGQIETDEVFRFPNGNVTKDGHLTWDIDSLFENIVLGIEAAFAKYPTIESLSIDTWGVDYVLMKGDEELYPCYAYRDSRTETAIPRVHGILPFAELYSRTGIQFQPFNTVYQLYDDAQKGRLDGVTDFLMMPEYLSYKLTGVKKKEYTNATTAGLVNAKLGEFDKYITRALGLPDKLFPALSAPGTEVGALLPEIADRVKGQTKVVLCASHDTASAVEGIGMQEDALYISSGTWSLLGVRVEKAICSEGSRLANYSNEGGVGYVRYQKNIMGMWTVQSLRRELCPDKDFPTIEKEAVESGFSGVVDVNDNDFLAPDSMKGAFDRAFAGREYAPKTDADYFSAAYHSLADSYKNAIAELEANTGKKYDSLYIVGGGAKNKYLNELTEKACGVKVIALPIEATSIGNLMIQMKAVDAANKRKYLLPPEGNFYKANLHCHTTVSDGKWTPEKVKDEYKKQGYSVVAYTDHNVMVPHGDLTDKDFLALTGFEINISKGRDANGNTPGGYKTCHICMIAPNEKDTDQVCVHRTKYLNIGNNQPELLETVVKYDRSLPDFERVYTSECINESMARAQEKGYFVTYNHPTWSQESYEQYMAYEGMDAMEICNFGCVSGGWQEYNPRVYDDMLRGGKRIFCIATDDNHNGRNDSFGGFTVIKANSLDYPTVFKALKDGHFYASQGPEIYELYLEGDKVTVKCSAAREIKLNTGVIRAAMKTADGTPLAEATFKLNPDDVYFRITVVDEKGYPADTNAYFLDQWVEF